MSIKKDQAINNLKAFILSSYSNSEITERVKDELLRLVEILNK